MEICRQSTLYRGFIVVQVIADMRVYLGIVIDIICRIDLDQITAILIFDHNFQRAVQSCFDKLAFGHLNVVRCQFAVADPRIAGQPLRSILRKKLAEIDIVNKISQRNVEFALAFVLFKPFVNAAVHVGFQIFKRRSLLMLPN